MRRRETISDDPIIYQALSIYADSALLSAQLTDVNINTHKYTEQKILYGSAACHIYIL